MDIPRYQGVNTQVQSSDAPQRAQMSALDTFISGVESIKQSTIQATADDAMARGEIKALDDVSKGELKVESLYTAYGKAYNNASRAAYQANVSMDMKSAASSLAIEHENDPEAFRQAFDAYGKKSIANVSGEVHQSITGQAFRQYGEAAYNSLMNKKQESINASNKKSLTAYANLMQEDYMAAVSAGDQVRATNSFLQLNALQEQLIIQGELSKGEMAFNNSQLQVKAYSHFTMSQFNDTEDKAGFINKFHESKHPMLNAAQIDEVDKLLKARLKSDNAMIKQQQDIAEDEILSTQVETAQVYNELMIDGGLTNEMLNESFKANDLSLSDYDRLTKAVANPGTKYDHEPTYLKTSRYLAEISEEEIIGQENLTYATRRKLIGDRKVALSKRLRWTTTENGREALRRIKSKFGILEGTLMAQVDFENKNMKNYDKMHQELYDSIMELPEDQRENKALGLATGLISQYEEIKKSEALESKLKKEAKIKATYQQKANTFNSGAFELFKRQIGIGEDKTWEEMLPKKYEYLKED